jgi:hypothetical protein
MEKARLIVLTDIGPWEGEPDDAQSLVRLVLYSNEYDIEGIIPNASWCNPDTSDEGFMNRILDVIHAYGKVRDNLLVHAPGYPSEEYLLSIVKRGTCHVDMAEDSFDWLQSSHEEIEVHKEEIKKGILKPNVGDGLSNDGSRLIQRALEKDDDRPLWIALWGGCGTLAQALYDMKRLYSAEEMESFCKKLRVYDVDGQDDCGGWICHHFPQVTWLRADMSFWGFSETPQRFNERYGENCYVGNLENVSEEWIRKNMQSIGALGKVYPMALWGMETDSPSILHLVQNGLSDQDHPNWGSWGGRFTLVKCQNVPAEHFRATYLKEEKPFYMYRDATDTWYDAYNGQLTYNNIFAPIARWREDYQNDMAVRMLWSVHDKYEECNHNPVVVLNGDVTKDAVVCNVKCGDIVIPDITGTYDPDDDELSYRWYVYPEEGTYYGEVVIEKSDTSCPEIHIPADAVNDEIHVILEVCDTGKDFPLKSYRRLILKTGETGFGDLQRYINDTEFIYSGAWEHRTDQYGCYTGNKFYRFIQ